MIVKIHFGAAQSKMGFIILKTPPALNTLTLFLARLSLIKNCDNKLIITSGGNQINIINSDGELSNYKTQLNLSSITDIEKTNEHFLISSKDFVVSTTSNFSKFEYLYIKGFKAKILSHSNQLIKINNRIFGYQTGRINEYINNKIDELETDFSEKIRGIVPFKNDILFWTKTGLYTFSINTKQQTKLTDVNKTNKVLVFDENTLIICTTKDGVFVFKNGVLKSIKLPIEFQTANFKDACLDEDNSIWFATNNGVLNMKYENNLEKFTSFSLEQGFPFIDCKSIEEYNHKIYMARFPIKV